MFSEVETFPEPNTNLEFRPLANTLVYLCLIRHYK